MIPPPLPSYLCPNPQNLWKCYSTGQGRLKVADGIKVATHFTLKWIDYPGLVRWAQWNYKSPLKWKREAEELVSEWCSRRKTWPVIADGRGHEPKNMGASTQACQTRGHWTTGHEFDMLAPGEGKKVNSFLKFPEGNQPGKHPGVAQWDPVQTSDI